jgi:hypothetical protein
MEQIQSDFISKYDRCFSSIECGETGNVFVLVTFVGGKRLSRSKKGNRLSSNEEGDAMNPINIDGKETLLDRYQMKEMIRDHIDILQYFSDHGDDDDDDDRQISFACLL